MHHDARVPFARLWHARMTRCTRRRLEPRHRPLCLLASLRGLITQRHPATLPFLCRGAHTALPARVRASSFPRFERAPAIPSPSALPAPSALAYPPHPCTRASPHSSMPPLTPTPRHARRPLARLRAVPARLRTSSPPCTRRQRALGCGALAAIHSYSTHAPQGDAEPLPMLSKPHSGA